MRFRVYNSDGDELGETEIGTINQLMEMSLTEGDPLILCFGELSHCEGYLTSVKEGELPTITVYNGYLE